MITTELEEATLADWGPRLAAQIRWPRMLTLAPGVVLGWGFKLRPVKGTDPELVASIGARSNIGARAIVDGFGEFAIGYRSACGDDCRFSVAGQLIIGDNVRIGDDVTFEADPSRRTFVGDDVSIGDGATIGGGVYLADGATVAAGTRQQPDS